MMSMKSDRSIGIWMITSIAVVFGLLTIKSGGSVLFIDGTFREEAGNYVPFVVWFNFLAGFVYLIAGGGLWMQKHWAVWVSIFIVVATLVVFAILGFISIIYIVIQSFNFGFQPGWASTTVLIVFCTGLILISLCLF